MEVDIWVLVEVSVAVGAADGVAWGALDQLVLGVPACVPSVGTRCLTRSVRPATR